MTLESIVETYGYAALLLGTFLEGETILIIAGFLAHRGYLQLSWVFVVAFIGSFAGDQLWFQVGRRKGIGWVEARPHWKSRAVRIHKVLERHRVPVMLGFRFVYGFRNLTPFVIGATGFRVRPFVILNALGAMIWSLSVASAGYFFGHAVEAIIHDVKRYELLLLGFVAIGGLVVWLLHKARQRWKRTPCTVASPPAPMSNAGSPNIIESDKQPGPSDTLK